MTARYLDIPGAAEYLSLTPGAVKRMISRHEIPFIRMGRRIRFDVTDLDAWMRKQRVETW